jgi:hypothetical protein
MKTFWCIFVLPKGADTPVEYAALAQRRTDGQSVCDPSSRRFGHTTQINIDNQIGCAALRKHLRSAE